MSKPMTADEKYAEAELSAAFAAAFPLVGYAMEVVEYARQHEPARQMLLAILAQPNSGGKCCFLIRPEEGTPADLKACGRTRVEHPVVGLGRYANHQNFLEREAELRTAWEKWSREDAVGRADKVLTLKPVPQPDIGPRIGVRLRDAFWRDSGQYDHHHEHGLTVVHQIGEWCPFQLIGQNYPCPPRKDGYGEATEAAVRSDDG